MNERGRADDRTVFERDGYACVPCEAEGDGPADLDVYRIDDDGDAPANRELLASVCERCHGTLRGDPPGWRRRLGTDPADGLLALLREVTTTQGSAVADVADFAATATGGVDADDEAARRRYLDDRRRVRLALAVVDRHLAGAGAETVDLGDDVALAFDAVRDEARTLQDLLVEVVVLAETAVAAAGRCHACLEPVVGDPGSGGLDRCDACGTAVREASEWTADDGEVSLAALYGTVNDRLQEASATTEVLTKRTGQLAELLTGRS